MVEDLITQRVNLKSSEEDNNISHVIAGKVLIARPYNFESFKHTMNQI